MHEHGALSHESVESCLAQCAAASAILRGANRDLLAHGFRFVCSPMANDWTLDGKRESRASWEHSTPLPYARQPDHFEQEWNSPLEQRV